MGRAPCCEKVGLKKGRWTEEEDEILTKYIQANGEGSWRSLPKNAGLLRCGKSCRLRWINYLRADLKRGNISVEEESTIIKLHASFGNRWSLIASHLPGRTDNEIKNYWNSHLSRKIYSFRGTTSNKDNNNNTTVPMIMDIPPKRRGGRTSRWAMKKNKIYASKLNNNNNNNNRPKQCQSDVTHQHHNNEAVPLPQTPALESENLTMVMDFIALDHDTEDKVEREKEKEKEKEEENVLCLVKEDTIINDMLYLNGEKNSEEILLGPGQEEVINDGGVLSFNDFMDTCFVEEASGVLSLTFGEDIESNYEFVGNCEKGNEEVAGVNTCTNKIESRVNQSLNNGETGELCSCNSSMASGLDDSEWDWESVMQLNNGNDVSESLENKGNLLTWLWEDDDDWGKDCHKELGDIDPDLDVMVAWFLS